VALRGRCAPGRRPDYQGFSLACTSRAVKAAALVGEVGHPRRRSGKRQARSDRDIATSQEPTAPNGSAT
jgi:hypothetical protein